MSIRSAIANWLLRPDMPGPRKLRDCDQRCVGAGHWRAINLDTGETRHIVRFGTLERRRRRDEFVLRNRDLCQAAHNVDHWHKGAMTKPGRIVVAEARKVLDYSAKSYDGDVFRFIMSSYERLFDPAPVPGCRCGRCKYGFGRNR